MRQHSSIHPNQHMIAYGCAVDNGAVSNCTLVANGEGCIGIDVQGAVVLNVGTATDDNGCGVPAHDCVIPDAGAFVDDDVANDHCTRGDKYVVCDGRPDTFIGKNRHG